MADDPKETGPVKGFAGASDPAFRRGSGVGQKLLGGESVSGSPVFIGGPMISLSEDVLGKLVRESIDAQVFGASQAAETLDISDTEADARSQEAEILVAEAAAMAKDEPVEAVALRVPNIRALRNSQGLTQIAFAETYGLSLDAVQNWEQRRRTPDRTARLLLYLIECNPEAVAAAAAAEREANGA